MRKAHKQERLWPNLPLESATTMANEFTENEEDGGGTRVHTQTRDKHTQTQTHRDRQTDTDKHRQTDRQTGSNWRRASGPKRLTTITNSGGFVLPRGGRDKFLDRQTDRQTHTHTHTHTHTQIKIGWTVRLHLPSLAQSLHHRAWQCSGGALVTAASTIQQRKDKRYAVRSGWFGKENFLNLCMRRHSCRSPFHICDCLVGDG